MDAPTPITVPAQAEVIADQMLIESLHLRYVPEDDRFTASATVIYYAEDEYGKKTFVEPKKSMVISDLFVEAANNPLIATAIQAISEAVVDKISKI